MATTSTQPTAPARRKRVPAEERREDVLRAAAIVVARDGMHAASTAEIARQAGISHAYLFRLFPTKDALLLEVARRCGDAMHRGMLQAGERAKGRGDDPLLAMGLEWTNQLRDHTNLLVSLQSITASRTVPALGDHLRAAWGEVVSDIARISGAGPDQVRAFVAQGMLLQVIAALGAEESSWASWLHHGPLPCGAERLGASGGVAEGSDVSAEAAGAVGSDVAAPRQSADDALVRTINAIRATTEAPGG